MARELAVVPHGFRVGGCPFLSSCLVDRSSQPQASSDPLQCGAVDGEPNCSASPVFSEEPLAKSGLPGGGGFDPLKSAPLTRPPPMGQSWRDGQQPWAPIPRQVGQPGLKEDGPPRGPWGWSGKQDLPPPPYFLAWQPLQGEGYGQTLACQSFLSHRGYPRITGRGLREAEGEAVSPPPTWLPKGLCGLPQSPSSWSWEGKAAETRGHPQPTRPAASPQGWQLPSPGLRFAGASNMGLQKGAAPSPAHDPLCERRPQDPRGGRLQGQLFLSHNFWSLLGKSHTNTTRTQHKQHLPMQIQPTHPQGPPSYRAQRGAGLPRGR